MYLFALLTHNFFLFQYRLLFVFNFFPESWTHDRPWYRVRHATNTTPW